LIDLRFILDKYECHSAIKIQNKTIINGAREKKMKQKHSPWKTGENFWTEVSSLDWKISVFGKSLCSSTAC
jgi:hypothetical protein